MDDEVQRFFDSIKFSSDAFIGTTVKKVIFNRPDLNCIKKGDIKLFDKLPDHKTLFKSNGKGLPLGNLTS